MATSETNTEQQGQGLAHAGTLGCLQCPLLSCLSTFYTDLLLTSPECKRWVLPIGNDITTVELTKRLGDFGYQCNSELKSW